MYLRLDSLPGLFTFVALLGGDRLGTTVGKIHPQKAKEAADKNTGESSAHSLWMHMRPLEVHGLRMLELTERQSSVMKESDLDDYSVRDPVVKAFHTFGQLSNVAISGEVQIVPEGSYANILSRSASDHGSDMVLLPWSETGRLSEAGDPLFLDPAQNPFSSGPHNQFVTAFLENAPCNAAIFVNDGFGQDRKPRVLHRVTTALSLRSTTGPPVPPIVDRSHHIVFPYFGGLDDRVALRFVLRLAQNQNVTATIINVNITTTHNTTNNFESASISSSPAKEASAQTASTEEPSYDSELAFFTAIKDSLPRDLEPRVLFSALNTQHPLRDTIEIARAETGLAPQNAGDLIVIGRGAKAVGKSALRRELESLRAAGFATLGGENGLGVVAEAIICGDVKASVLVVQAGTRVPE